MSKLERKIRGGIKKDVTALLESLLMNASDENSVKAAVSTITELVSQEQQLTEDRKKLSRQIGVVKAEGQDASELITGVSRISKEIKQLGTDINLQIEIIDKNIGKGSTEADGGAVRCPAHLKMSDDKLSCDVAALTLDHSDDFDLAEWQRYVDSVPHSNVYHDVKWCDLIKQQFGHQSHYITCRLPSGELCGVFPTVHLNSKLFGSFLVSMPYFNYGGPLSQYPSVSNRMMEYASEVGRSLACTHLEARDTQRREPWLVKDHKVTMILPLPQSDEILDRQLGSKIRAQVNKAAREDLEYTVGGAELLDDFYKVFSHNMRDLGTPVYDKQFFASILESFADQTNITVVRHNGKPVAAGFLLGYKDKLEIPWASSLRKANPLGANMYMYRQILKTAIDQGYQFFDFGRSSKDASTYRYKKQWGATEYPLYWHYWLHDSDELPELNPNNPKYKLAIAMWQKLPVAVANVIGPTLVRNLP